MSQPQLHLVSFPICPYVQRSVITLKHKKIPFSVTYIDFKSPPEWFLQKSPTGKVPMLLVDDQHVLFESAVINEYLDEISPPSLLPADPLARAKARAWIAFGSDLLGSLYRWMTARSEESFKEVRDELSKALQRLEEQCKAEPYFLGAEFTLLDSTLAPLFMRLELLADAENPWKPENYPQLARWWSHMATLPQIQESVIEDFRERLTRYLRGQEGFAGPRLAAHLAGEDSGH